MAKDGNLNRERYIPARFQQLAVYMHGSFGGMLLFFGSVTGVIALVAGKLRGDPKLLLFSVWPISLTFTVLILRWIFTESTG